MAKFFRTSPNKCDRSSGWVFVGYIHLLFFGGVFVLIRTRQQSSKTFTLPAQNDNYVYSDRTSTVPSRGIFRIQKIQAT
jgi:hypothetical protein